MGDDAMCFKSGLDMKKIIISIMMLGLVYKKVGSRTLKLEVFSPIQSKSPCLGIVMILWFEPYVNIIFDFLEKVF